MTPSVVVALLVAVSSLHAQQTAPADLIVTNARIYTADSARPTAQALAIRAGRVVRVGSASAVNALKGPNTQLLDVAGKTVIPGMTDAHVHLLGMGQALRNVDLVGTTSYQEVVARVAARAKDTPKGTWIVGRGWDQNDWPDTKFPTHEALSRAVPDNPVFLTRVDGHAGLANAQALAIANVTAATKDPSGGRIEHDAAGAPTGVFVDNAMGLVGGRIPRPTRQDLESAVVAAVHETARWGLTSVHDAGVDPATIEVYEALSKEGKFTLRDYVMIDGNEATIAQYFPKGPQNALYDGHLWIRAVKLYADGALGSRGAALLEPYTDDPKNTGLLRFTPGHIKDVSTRALKAGFQVNVHAIGDRGNRLVLDEFEAALAGSTNADHRFRIEHAQIISPNDIPRFAKLHVIPSMQASHQTSDMYWAEKRLGPVRIKGAYAWRSLLNTGVIIPNGSDFPVEQVNPLISFHAAFTRQDAKNWPAGGWYPEQKMTRDEAFKAMTVWPARAAFQEKDLGSLSTGKYADFVVLDQDIMTVPPEQVLKTQVLATYIGGKPVYKKP
jgi:predicted amidohydrolase YtcJ